MLTKGAIGNLVNRYRAVLKKCHLINTFGSLAVASMLVMGGAGVAMAGETPFLATDGQVLSGTYENQNNNDGTLAGVVTVDYTTSDVTIADGTKFINNSTEASAGGAAKIMNGITIGNNVQFENNKATNKGWGGGALYIKLADGTTTSPNDRVVIGDNAKFIGNTAGLGGAIALEYGDLSFGQNALFEKNQAAKGGAIAMWQDANDHGDYQSQLTLDNVVFKKNSATEYGGAIFVGPNSGTVTIADGIFESNSASSAGGAIYNTGNMTVGGTFTDNSAAQGGAIMNYTGDEGTALTISDGSKFISNKASTVGGAISHVDAGKMVIGNNVLFEDNQSIGGQGGALHSQRASTVIGNNAKFYNNIAKGYGGGAIYQDTDSTASSVTIGTGAEFIGNETETSHGGAIMNFDGGNGATLTIGAGAKFDSNKAGKTGGAISNWGGITSVTDAIFTNNSAFTNGGAIYNDNYSQENSSFAINGATFTGNSADAQGGAVYNGGTLTFSGDNLFENNTAADVANDVHNKGILTVADGTTLMNSGYTQEGETSALIVKSGATLGIAMPDLGGVAAENGEALLALGQNLDLSNGGSLKVGNISADNDAQLAFGSDSMLVVDGKVAQNGAAITGNDNDKITVEKGSRLYIANAQADEAYTITDRINTSENEYWDAANLLAGRLIEADITTTPDGDIVVMTEGRDAAAVLPGIIPVAALNTMTGDQLYDVDASDMGVRFLSRAMDNSGTYLTGDAQAIDTVNEVSRAAVTAGVQNTALRLADAGADQLIHHLSLSFFGKENNIHKDGVDIWATPMYGNTYTHGMTASGTSVRGNYGGMVLGADALVGEIMGGKVRVGAAINGGGGKSETRGTATSTENSYNFGGVNLYAGWNLDSLNVMASVGYAMADHDVEMNLPAALGMGRADADVDTNAFIADLRAEYQINTSVVDVLPHAGVRYTALNTESHDLKVNGSTLNSVASDTQHIVQFPIGVTLSKDIDVSGWNVKPLADVSVIPAAGEKKNTTKVSYSGINAVDGVNTRIMDSTSWSGMIGVQAEKGNFALGLNYGIQASSHETDQNVNLGFSWKF